MDVLYHASQNKELILLEPKQTLSKDKCIGDYLFATSDKLLATMYLVTKGYGALFGSRDNPPHIVIGANKDEYMANDKGGAIYELPVSSFIESPQVELSEYEMVSTKSVKFLKRTIFDNSLDAMHSAGVKIHFVDQKTFDNLIHSPRQTELIRKLPEYTPVPQDL